MTETPTPVTIPGALRGYLQANLPELPIFRNSAAVDSTVPLVVIIDPTDTRTEEIGKDLVLVELIQVDLYLAENDYSSLPDALHALLHRAPIGIPGSQIHNTRVLDRRVDQTDPGNDDGVTRVIFTLEVKRRITAGDNTTPLPFPVRPDRLQVHEAKTTNVHGITDTSKLETKTGASTKANAAQAAAEANANAYTDAAIANVSVPENVETIEGSQAKADAALTAANTYTDTAVSSIDLTPYATTTALNTATDNALTEANAYTDSKVGSIDFSTLETKTGATDKADAAEAAANSYTDSYAVPLSDKGVPSGVATLGSNGLIPSNQLPPLAITDTFVVNSEAEMLALTAEVGDLVVRTDISKSFILQTANPSVLGNWKELLTPPDTILSVDGRTGSVSLTDLYDAAGAAATALTSANAYTDSKVGSIDFSTLETKTGATDKADAAEAAAVLTANAYTDAAKTAAIADANDYTDTAISNVAQTRKTVSVSSSSLAAGASENLTVTLGKAFRLFTITTNVPARVRIYSTVAARTADANRVLGWKPAWNAGVIAEIATSTGALSGSLMIDGANLESTPVSDIAISVTNLSNSASPVTVGFTYIVTEA